MFFVWGIRYLWFFCYFIVICRVFYFVIWIVSNALSVCMCLVSKWKDRYFWVYFDVYLVVCLERRRFIIWIL